MWRDTTVKWCPPFYIHESEGKQVALVCCGWHLFILLEWFGHATEGSIIANHYFWMIIFHVRLNLSILVFSRMTPAPSAGHEDLLNDLDENEKWCESNAVKFTVSKFQLSRTRMGDFGVTCLHTPLPSSKHHNIFKIFKIFQKIWCFVRANLNIIVKVHSMTKRHRQSALN